MYIHPYLAGVLTVIAAEIVIFISLTIYLTTKNKGGKK